MDVSIDIENSPNMSSVLREIEGQRNLRAFNAIAPGITQIHRKITRTNSVLSLAKPLPNQRYIVGHQTSDPTAHKRQRILSAPSPMVEAGKMKVENRLTAAEQKLSKEEMALLEGDILTPMDVYSIERKIREKNCQ